ncbi:EF-hand domain-containing protein [Streptomyces sp. NPDC127068]|uniref:EF-hand domain-containing protein n=1 Tax=Streptomyces sp. NPDC127068 TaxID=3347127 RepID=UPI00364B2B1C
MDSEDRLRFRFALLDADGNGVLERSDFETLAERVIAASGVEESTRKAAAVREAHLAYWQGLSDQADSNNDGVVDFDEYVAVVHQQETFEQYVRPYIRALVALADGDDDGWVGHDAFSAIMTAVGFPRANSEAAFADFRSLEGGQLSTTFWGHVITGFYTGRGRHITDQLIGPPLK